MDHHCPNIVIVLGFQLQIFRIITDIWSHRNNILRRLDEAEIPPSYQRAYKSDGCYRYFFLVFSNSNEWGANNVFGDALLANIQRIYYY